MANSRVVATQLTRTRWTRRCRTRSKTSFMLLPTTSAIDQTITELLES
uniref:Uncharacterized protein n=1 Tax=Ciona intestinalis TaxID=7719 RepID=L7N0V3_CIOIN